MLLAFTPTRADIIDIDITGESSSKKKADEDKQELLTSSVGRADSLHRLNRFTFHEMILNEKTNSVPHWIVLFCPPWFEPCKAAEQIFRNRAEHWQEKLNTALFTTEVRFATVDCATEKALCNTQNVDTYPFVAHYLNAEQVSRWRGKSYDTDVQRFTKFLQQELGTKRQEAMKSASTETAEAVLAPGGDFTRIPVSRAVNLLVLVVAIAGNAWFIFSAWHSAGSSADKIIAPAEVKNAETIMPTTTPMPRVVRCLPKEWGHERPSIEL